MKKSEPAIAKAREGRSARPASAAPLDAIRSNRTKPGAVDPADLSVAAAGKPAAAGDGGGAEA